MADSATKPVRIAIYDMDKTVTKSPTYGWFLWFVLTRYRPWRLLCLPVMIVFGMGYLVKLVSRSRLKELNLTMAMGRRINRSELADIAQAFARHCLDTNRLTMAVAQIAADRRAGYSLVMATASFRFYAEAIGREVFGFDHVIGTECEIHDACTVLPAIKGENCYGAVKLTMVKDWLSREGIARESAHIRFYSDHVSDEPCLAWADEGFAVNPHDRLRALAVKRGWPVFDWS